VKCKYDSDCAGISGHPDAICVADAGGSRCHAGNFVGEQVVTLGSPMDEGDCLIFTQTSLTTIPPGEEGPDGIHCTDDDEPAHSDAIRIPLTTGAASSRCEDCIVNTMVAQCVNNPLRAGPCLEDRDCWADATNSTGAFCDKTGSSRGTLASQQMVGTAAQCRDYETSDLGTLDLVGAIPITDGTGLGDEALSFRFICE
jgi:hypothetical protein